MTYNWQTGTDKFKAAAKVVTAIIDSMYQINNEIEFGVRLYGSEYPSQEKNCGDTRLVVPFNLQNIDQIKRKLQYVTPMGVSPIAYSLRQAAENELSQSDQYDYSFVLLSDGGESCGGDICDVYRKLLLNKIKVAPYIIGLEYNDQLKSYYECLGQYVSVLNNSDIPKAVELIVKNNQPLLNKPKVLNLPEYKPEVLKKVESDAFTFIPSIKPNLSSYTFSNPKSTPNLKYTIVSIPKDLQLVAIVPVVKDELSYIPPIVTKFKGGEWKKIFTARPMKTIRAKIPQELMAEAVSESFFMSNLETTSSNASFETKLADLKPKPIKLKKTNLPSEFTIMEAEAMALNEVPLFNTITTFDIKPKSNSILFIKFKNKTNLPSEITTPEQLPLDMSSLSTTKSNVTFSQRFSNNKLAKAIQISKTNLPEALNTVEPIDMSLLASANNSWKASAKTFTNNAKTIKTNATNLPEKVFEVEIPPYPMPALYSAQFRISFSPPREVNPRQWNKPRTIVAIPKELVVKKVIKKATPPPPISTEKPVFKLETEESTDTRIAVYFTDGLGKFYSAKPMIALVDPVTKKTVKTFMRDIIRAGEPEPVKLDIDGVFDVTVLGQRDISLENVPIEKNKLNKIILKVTNGTLIFTYANNRERPVEHKALVMRRFSDKNKQQITMLCTDQKMFEPGEYYVSIDIIPRYEISTEISFGAITEIQIPQEGAMQINSNDIGTVVTLYFQNGDTYEEFKSIRITGVPDQQRLELRPGPYKASFVLPGMPKNAPPTIVSFQVKTNTETSFELKDYKDLMVTPGAIGKPVYVNEAPEIEFINANPTLDGNGKSLVPKKK